MLLYIRCTIPIYSNKDTSCAFIATFSLAEKDASLHNYAPLPAGVLYESVAKSNQQCVNGVLIREISRYPSLAASAFRQDSVMICKAQQNSDNVISFSISLVAF